MKISEGAPVDETEADDYWWPMTYKNMALQSNTNALWCTDEAIYFDPAFVLEVQIIRQDFEFDSNIVRLHTFTI